MQRLNQVLFWFNYLLSLILPLLAVGRLGFLYSLERFGEGPLHTTINFVVLLMVLPITLVYGTIAFRHFAQQHWASLVGLLVQYAIQLALNQWLLQNQLEAFSLQGATYFLGLSLVFALGLLVLLFKQDTRYEPMSKKVGRIVFMIVLLAPFALSYWLFVMASLQLVQPGTTAGWSIPTVLFTVEIIAVFVMYWFKFRILYEHQAL